MKLGRLWDWCKITVMVDFMCPFGLSPLRVTRELVNVSWCVCEGISGRHEHLNHTLHKADGSEWCFPSVGGPHPVIHKKMEDREIHCLLLMWILHHLLPSDFWTLVLPVLGFQIQSLILCLQPAEGGPWSVLASMFIRAIPPSKSISLPLCVCVCVCACVHAHAPSLLLLSLCGSLSVNGTARI